jgi:plastocyanin
VTASPTSSKTRAPTKKPTALTFCSDLDGCTACLDSSNACVWKESREALPSPTTSGAAKPPTAAVAAGRTVTVEATGSLKFDPASVTIEVGDTIKWKNLGEGHNVAQTASATDNIYMEGGFTSGSASFGGTDVWEHVFKTEGTFYYVCTPHASLQMRASVTVTKAVAGGATPTPAPTTMKPTPQPSKLSENKTFQCVEDTQCKENPFAGVVCFDAECPSQIDCKSQRECGECIAEKGCLWNIDREGFGSCDESCLVADQCYDLQCPSPCEALSECADCTLDTCQWNIDREGVGQCKEGCQVDDCPRECPAIINCYEERECGSCLQVGEGSCFWAVDRDGEGFCENECQLGYDCYTVCPDKLQCNGRDCNTCLEEQGCQWNIDRDSVGFCRKTCEDSFCYADQRECAGIQAQKCLNERECSECMKITGCIWNVDRDSSDQRVDGTCSSTCDEVKCFDKQCPSTAKSLVSTDRSVSLLPEWTKSTLIRPPVLPNLENLDCRCPVPPKEFLEVGIALCSFTCLGPASRCSQDCCRQVEFLSDTACAYQWLEGPLKAVAGQFKFFLQQCSMPMQARQCGEENAYTVASSRN